MFDKKVLAQIMCDGMLERLEYLEQCEFQVNQATRVLDKLGAAGGFGGSAYFIHARIEDYVDKLKAKLEVAEKPITEPISPPAHPGKS